jgi:multidrug resistance efflux pump
LRIEQVGADVEKEISALKKRADALEKELVRLENLEKSLANHEIVLASKVSDMNRMEEGLKDFVSKPELDDVWKELKRVEDHEKLLFENSRMMREVISELSKVKESHKITRTHLMEADNVSRQEFEEKLTTINAALGELEHIRNTHRKKAGHDDLAALKEELQDRLSQIDYQHKLIMQYLKKVDDELKKRGMV